MSTLAYAALTRRREKAGPGTSFTTQPPGVGPWVDSLSSLVPSEVLAVHGALLAITTTTDNASGTVVTTITDPTTLKGVFYALIFVSMLLYVGGRAVARSWDRLDFARVLIPPLAFVAWTMLQKSTGFDAAFPELAIGPRTAIALIGGVVLGVVAGLLAYKADQKKTN
jgi:hypothetical protein